MALILHLETASPVCSVGLSRDGQLLGSRESKEDKSHATQLTLMIRDLLSDNHLTAGDLDAISLSMGPGSYTGLRIGASVAKGLAYGSGKPVIGIPTLKALASGFAKIVLPGTPRTESQEPVLLCPMLDARRMEVYSAIYDVHLNEIAPVGAVILERGTFNHLLNSQIHFFGTGSAKASELIDHPNARFHEGFELSAAFQTDLALTLYANHEFLDTAYFEPHYLKEFIASIPRNKIPGWVDRNSGG